MLNALWYSCKQKWFNLFNEEEIKLFSKNQDTATFVTFSSYTK